MATRKRKKVIVFSLIGLLLIALTLSAVFAKREAVITIQTEKVVRRNITELVVANGKIQPVTQVMISPEVAGEIVALPVKEGDSVRKGDVLVQIKPDNYRASRNSAEANYQSAIASKQLAQAELDRAEAEFNRNQELFQNKLVSDSVFIEVKTAFEVAKLRHQNATHSENQAKFGLDKAIDDLSKTTILSPIDGTITRLNSQLGERVLGTSFNKGTEIMTVSDLNAMEARVDIGETDVNLIQPGQAVRLEVDAFKDRKFGGVVTDIANSAKGSAASGMGSSQQEATKFEVRVRVQEKEAFRPGMSVTAEIETRTRTNALAVPIASVTTRVLKDGKGESGGKEDSAAASNETAKAAGTDAAASQSNTKKEENRPVELVFRLNSDRVKAAPVKIGISDDSYWEILEGLEEGDEVVSGGHRAISQDLEDGKKVVKGKPAVEKKEM
jgi:HlyD family secretion protein